MVFGVSKNVRVLDHLEDRRITHRLLAAASATPRVRIARALCGYGNAKAFGLSWQRSLRGANLTRIRAGRSIALQLKEGTGTGAAWSAADRGRPDSS